MTHSKTPQSQREARLIARKALLHAGDVGFKPITSAKWTNIFRTWDGIRHVQIEHDNVKQCTPAMIKWWFQNISGKTTWNGVDFSGPPIMNYHLWHHRDHISVSNVGETREDDPPGLTLHGKFRIQEQFEDYGHRIDVVISVDRIDESEMTFTAHRFGVAIAKLVHVYSSEDGGCRFYTETIAGLTIPVLGWILNWLLMPFLYSKRTAEQWIRHNIEEIGQTEKFVPILYSQYDNRT